MPPSWLALWKRVQQPLELLMCVLALATIVSVGVSGADESSLLLALRLAFLIWVVFSALELRQHWSSRSKAMKSSIPEIYERYRTRDPRFARSTAADVLGPYSKGERSTPFLHCTPCSRGLRPVVAPTETEPYKYV